MTILRRWKCYITGKHVPDEGYVCSLGFTWAPYPAVDELRTVHTCIRCGHTWSRFHSFVFTSEPDKD